ncbi:MAG: hypothetical protein JNL43_11745 [Flavobacteriales bacterium]|nr:hypothetical protein [Flavobacteriales bacterium]
MSTRQHRVLFAAAGALALTGLRAQGTPPEGEYVIQGVFSPTIADARKIDLVPQPMDTILPDRPVAFDVMPVKAEIPSKVDSLAAAKLNVVQPQQKLYKGFVKAGFGLYTTPLGEFYFDQTRSRNEAYGLHVKHFSSNGGLDDVGPSTYSFNGVDGYYNHYLRNHEVGGRLMYDRRRVSYYGYDANDSTLALIDAAPAEEDDLKQIYNDIGFAGRIRSLYKDSTLIAHDVGLEVHAYSNLSESRETNVRITAELSKAEQGDRYGVGVLIDNNAYRGKESNGLFGEVESPTLGDKRTNGTLVGLVPLLTREGDHYVVRVGTGIYVDAQGNTSFHFFPKAYLSYSLFDDILVPYIGLEGERRRNSLRSLTRENPWLIGRPDLVNSSLLYDFYGGLRGSFSSKIGFDARVSISSIEDRPLYVSAPNYPFGDRMAVVYDRVDAFTVSGELSYRYDESLRLKARAEISTYSTEQEVEAWNLPPYELTFSAVYSLQEKLIVTGEALFLGQRKAAFYSDPADATAEVKIDPATKDLDGFLDLHLGLEYRYTKRLSLFLDISNLSASKYERWYRYPVQRGLVLGGATYSF